MNAPEPWSILPDVAKHLHVSEDTVLRWIVKKKLPAHRVGRVWRFRLSEVDGWVCSGGDAKQSDEDSGRIRPAVRP